MKTYKELYVKYKIVGPRLDPDSMCAGYVLYGKRHWWSRWEWLSFEGTREKAEEVMGRFVPRQLIETHYDKFGNLIYD